MTTTWASKHHRELARAIAWANPQKGIAEIVNRIPHDRIIGIGQRDLEALGIRFAPPPVPANRH